MYDLILKNCNVVNENKITESDIAIRSGRIELVASSISSESKKTMDINGRFVLPGLIDDQVHFREPGLTHKGDISTCLLYTSPSPRDSFRSRMPSSA